MFSALGLVSTILLSECNAGLVRADVRRIQVYFLGHTGIHLWPQSPSFDYHLVTGHRSTSTCHMSMPSVSHFAHEASPPAGYEEE
ncbi:hypothetical protein EDD15DRAFT_2322552, partial [Pisolithus albus]